MRAKEEGSHVCLTCNLIIVLSLINYTRDLSGRSACPMALDLAVFGLRSMTPLGIVRRRIP